MFFPTLDSNGDGTLTVVLNAESANGTVVADAMGAAQAWASTGGPTPFESEPSYQLAVQNTGQRMTPDVSFDASENSGVTDFIDGGLNYGAFGTSLGSPCWAGLIAVVNQGRVADGGGTLNTAADPTQTLQGLYSLPASDFNSITSGYNGFTAGSGYNLVTGLGSPVANLLIPALVSYDLATGRPPTIPPLTPVPTHNPAPTPSPRSGPAPAPTPTPTPAPTSTPPPAAPPRPAPRISGIRTTTTVALAHPRPTTFGQAVNLTASVTHRSRASGIPTGQVAFWDGATLLGTKTLRGGNASLFVTSLPLGRDTITVIYAGGPDSSASKSTIVENVKAPRTKDASPRPAMSERSESNGMPSRKRVINQPAPAMWKTFAELANGGQGLEI